MFYSVIDLVNSPLTDLIARSIIGNKWSKEMKETNDTSSNGRIGWTFRETDRMERVPFVRRCTCLASITTELFTLSLQRCFLLVRCDFEHVVYGKQHRPILILSISERKRENEDTDYSSEINRVNCPRRTASKHWRQSTGCSLNETRYRREGN